MIDRFGWLVNDISSCASVASAEVEVRQAVSMRCRPRRVPPPQSGFAGFRFPPDVTLLCVCQDRLRRFLLSPGPVWHIQVAAVTCEAGGARRREQGCSCAGHDGGGHRGGEGAIELAGDVALDTSPDLPRALAFGRAPGDVGLDGRVAADPRVGDDVDRLAQRPVAAPGRTGASAALVSDRSPASAGAHPCEGT